MVIQLDFGRLPASDKASDINKHILATKRGIFPSQSTLQGGVYLNRTRAGQEFPSPYIVVRQRQEEGDREGEELLQNRIASFFFKSLVMKYLREVRFPAVPDNLPH